MFVSLFLLSLSLPLSIFILHVLLLALPMSLRALALFFLFLFLLETVPSSQGHPFGGSSWASGLPRSAGPGALGCCVASFSKWSMEVPQDQS